MAAEKKTSILSLQRMLKAQHQHAVKILIFVTNFNVKEQDPLLLETRRDEVLTMRQTYFETESKLYGLVKEEESSSIEMQGEEFSDMLNEILYQVTKKLRPLSNPPETKPSLDNSIAQRTCPDSSIKLPDISLPKFNGHYEEWIYFRNQFNLLVRRNEALNDQQRLFYLRSCLIKVAQSIEAQEESFSSLWRALEAKYENRRWLVDRHLAEIFQIDALQFESASALQDLVNVVQKNLRALSSLKLSLDSLSEVMVVHVVASRLDEDTHKAFESHVVGQKLVKWQEMADFLQSRCHILENLEQAKEQDGNLHHVQPKPTGTKLQSKVLVSATRDDEKKSFGCFNCTGSHYINECRSFLDLSVEQRFHRVKELRLCVNCFSNRHVVADCKSGNCRKCGLRHNTLLHFESKMSNEEMSPQSSSSSVHPRAIQSKIEPDQEPEELIH